MRETYQDTISTYVTRIMLVLSGVLFVHTTFAASNDNVESIVRSTYADVPILIEIAHCESNFRHYGSDGEVLRSGYGDSIIGVMQLHATYHSGAATARDLDLADLEDHLAYARMLYDTEGTGPWSGSRACWQKAPTGTAAAVDRVVIERKIAQLMIEIYKLQIQLLTLKLSALKSHQ